jgi:hypothetical protein
VIPHHRAGFNWEGGVKTPTHPPMRPYEGDQMQDYEQSNAEASVLGPRRHDYGGRKKRRIQKSRRYYIFNLN